MADRRERVTALLAFGCALAISICVGTVGLFLAYQLPEKPIAQTVQKSLPVLKEEQQYPIILDSENGIRDNFTDALMLNTAAFDADGSLRSALSGTRGIPKDIEFETQIQCLDMVLSGEFELLTNDYFRYWHGYLVFLKPLLFLGLDLYAIRILQSIFAIALALANVFLMHKRNASLLVPPFLAMLICTMSFIGPLSLQYSNVLNVSLIANASVIALAPQLQKTQWLVFAFTIIGAATSYFDLLTYPIMALGVPLISWLFVSRSRPLRKLLYLSSIAILLWASGYAFMWASKWFLASLFVTPNAVEISFSQIQFRTSMSQEHGGDSFTISELVGNLARHIISPYFIIPICLVATPLSIDAIRRALKGDASVPAVTIISAIVLFVPIAWLLVLSNHTFVHHWMTYKNLGVSVYAFLTGLAAVAYCTPDSDALVRFAPETTCPKRSQ